MIAPPRMAYYMEVSAKIYSIYLKYIAPEDIHVYSIDEVFMDITSYLAHYGMSAYDLAKTIIREVLYATGITATAGIGTNLYLSKLAMDIVAKHTAPDPDGVRIASLNEESFRYLLWDHQPLTDFWQIGTGTVRKLRKHGIHTMGELARASLTQEEMLFKEFGIDAEILIDHAWGIEPCRMEDIKSYRPADKSICEGQVLSCPYPYEKARLIVQEMTESLAFRLSDLKMITDSLTLTVGYDRANCTTGSYQGEIHIDHYGRSVPKAAHGTIHLDPPTNLGSRLIDAASVCMPDHKSPAPRAPYFDRGQPGHRRSWHLPAQSIYRYEKAGKRKKAPGNNAGYQKAVWEKFCVKRHQLFGRRHHAGAKRTDRRS